MGWSIEEINYQDGEVPSVTTILDKIGSRLNEFNKSGSASAKIAVSDQSEGRPKGLLIHNQNLDLNKMNPNQLTLNWIQKKVVNENFPTIINSLTGYLNELTDLQLFYSQITLSKYTDGPYTCSLFYRQ